VRHLPNWPPLSSELFPKYLHYTVIVATTKTIWAFQKGHFYPLGAVSKSCQACLPACLGTFGNFLNISLEQPILGLSTLIPPGKVKVEIHDTDIKL
jgi:hypothetical protein